MPSWAPTLGAHATAPGGRAQRRREFAAAAVEQRQRIAGAQAQHAHRVDRRRLGQLDLHAARQRQVDVGAWGGHRLRRSAARAGSIAAAATSTMRSISAGVITYGGMK